MKKLLPFSVAGVLFLISTYGCGTLFNNSSSSGTTVNISGTFGSGYIVPASKIKSKSLSDVTIDKIVAIPFKAGDFWQMKDA